MTHVLRTELNVKISNNVAILVMAFSITACGPTDAGSQSKGARPEARRVLDVSGVTSGMPLSEAKRRLEAKGFTISTNPGPSWTAVLRSAVEQVKTGAPPRAYDQMGVTDMYARKGGETVTFNWVTPTPDGGQVNSIIYSVPVQGRSREELRASVQAKYGTPTQDSGKGRMAWCARGDICVAGKNQLPMIRYDEDERANLYLDPGERFASEVKARKDAAVTAAAGKPTTSF